jgi:hypothetical protein
MKKLLGVALALVLTILLTQFALAGGQAPAKKSGDKPGAVVAESVTVTAAIEAVDVQKRVITLKMPDGAVRAFKVGKEVKNFDQIKAGDKVKTTYFESIAIFVRKSSEKAGAAEVETVGVAPKGQKPGVFAVDTTEVTAKVEGVDYKKRTVTLKGPEGRVATFPVDKGVKRFKAVKVGDEVVLRITDAVAIAVETP